MYLIEFGCIWPSQAIIIYNQELMALMIMGGFPLYTFKEACLFKRSLYHSYSQRSYLLKKLLIKSLDLSQPDIWLIKTPYERKFSCIYA